MRTNQNSIDSIRKLRVRRSGSTLPDLTHLINEDEAETLGVTQAWKAAVVESKTRTLVENDAAKPELPIEAAGNQPAPIPTIPNVEEAAEIDPGEPKLSLPESEASESAPTISSEPDVPEPAELAAAGPAVKPTLTVFPTTPESIDEDSHDRTPRIELGETLKQIIAKPVVKKGAYYTAIVLGAMTFFFIVDPNGKSMVDSPTQNEQIAQQEPLHSEPLVESDLKNQQQLEIPVTHDEPVWDAELEAVATGPQNASDSSLLEDLGTPDDSEALMSSLRDQKLAQAEHNQIQETQVDQTPVDSQGQFPVHDVQAEQPTDNQFPVNNQFGDYQSNEFTHQDDRATYQPPAQGLHDNRYEPVLNAPLNDVPPSQPVYEETRPENFAFPIDAIPKAISLLRENRRLR